MKRRFSDIVLFLLVPAIMGSAQEANLIPGQELVDNTRQLMQYIESIHPDPYLYSGGKVALHRRFQDILQSIPAGGMEREGYINLIRPLVASISDGHTRIASGIKYDRQRPGGIPLSFGSVEDLIFVDGVTREEDLKLIGAKLLDVEGVTIDCLLERLRREEGIENPYHGLMRLKSYLRAGPYLSAIVPEWKDHQMITAGFEIKGSREEITFHLPVTINNGYLKPESRIRVPAENRDFLWFLTAPDSSTAILKIDALTAYREMYESISDSRDVKDELKTLYLKLNRGVLPDSLDALLKGIPSAIELFSGMVIAMKAARTMNLIIDLSKNGGGNSLMGDILTYFLYGKQALAAIISESPPVKKYSPAYFEWRNGKSLEALNKDYSGIQSYSLSEYDYDFTTERYVKLFASGRLDTLSGLKLKYRSVPSFIEEIKSGRYEKYYTPENIIVTCSNGTYSSAFTLLRYLKSSGAMVAGSVSGQSGNGFGNILDVKLTNSGILISISHDSYINFPDRPGERGILLPDYLLTYNDFVRYGFDPNAEIRLALEVLD